MLHSRHPHANIQVGLKLLIVKSANSVAQFGRQTPWCRVFWCSELLVFGVPETYGCVFESPFGSVMILGLQHHTHIRGFNQTGKRVGPASLGRTSHIKLTRSDTTEIYILLKAAISQTLIVYLAVILSLKVSHRHHGDKISS